MIQFEQFTLDNGLRVLVYPEPSTPMAAINILYDVGARDEHPEHTGFAHLFEHLMFEGSKNIPNYDTPLQYAGGSNNAFTNNDITNYYLTLPAVNLELGFWLESDRMLELGFSEEKLAIQKKVVIEEFKQRYLNQPYGDIWLLSRPLSYQVHPYQWPTIGKEISHIEDATLQQVKDFFFSYYAPNNAILVVAGGVEVAQVKALAEKWFGSIPKRNVPVRNLPPEPHSTAEKRQRVTRNVPQDALFMGFYMGGRTDAAYPAIDLISDILSSGKSARLYQALVKEQELFTEIGAYVSGSIDPGQLMVTGKVKKGVAFEHAEAAVWQELEKIANTPILDDELQKVKNKMITNEQFGMMSILNVAMKLAFASLLGDANLVNTDLERYKAVSALDIQQQARTLFTRANASVLEYIAAS